MILPVLNADSGLPNSLEFLWNSTIPPSFRKPGTSAPRKHRNHDHTVRTSSIGPNAGSSSFLPKKLIQGKPKNPIEDWDRVVLLYDDPPKEAKPLRFQESSFPPTSTRLNPWPRRNTPLSPEFPGRVLPTMFHAYRSWPKGHVNSSTESTSRIRSHDSTTFSRAGGHIKGRRTFIR
jgi:hypothetical protein